MVIGSIALKVIFWKFQIFFLSTILMCRRWKISASHYCYEDIFYASVPMEVPEIWLKRGGQSLLLFREFCQRKYCKGGINILTDYGCQERRWSSLRNRKFTPKFLGMAKAHFVSQIVPIFRYLWFMPSLGVCSPCTHSFSEIL